MVPDQANKKYSGTRRSAGTWQEERIREGPPGGACGQRKPVEGKEARSLLGTYSPSFGELPAQRESDALSPAPWGKLQSCW